MLTYSIGYWEVYRRFQRGFFLVVGGSGSGVMWKDLTMKEVFHGRRDIAMKGVPDFPALLKKKIRN